MILEIVEELVIIFRVMVFNSFLFIRIVLVLKFKILCFGNIFSFSKVGWLISLFSVEVERKGVVIKI